MDKPSSVGQDPPERSSSQRRPWWLPGLAALAGITLTAAAGSWQIDRAHQKQRLQARYERAMAAAPVRLGTSGANIDDLLMRRVAVTGSFVRGGLVLLDNRTRSGVPGYEVIMPLRIEDSGRQVLVNRGWIAAGPDRAHLPDIRTPEGRVEVLGTAVVPGRFLELSKQREVGPVWQNLTIERYSARTGIPVEPFVVQQLNQIDDGLWRAGSAPDFGIAMHYGYALQWFLLCALILFLYVYFHVKRSRSKENQEDTASAGRN